MIQNAAIPETAHNVSGDKEPVSLSEVKPRLSDDVSRRAATTLKALADPTRLQILDVLSQWRGELSVHDLEGIVGLPDPKTGQRPRQPTISHHLRMLRDAGFVDCQRRGLWVYYFVRRERINDVQRLLNILG